MHKFHQTLVGGRMISLEYYRPRKDPENEDANDKSENIPSVSSYVKKLYATSHELRFDQPPPPYLKYSYPKVNTDILDSIFIALMSNSRFYTQVLHLMNRMNLDPPFGPKCAHVEFQNTEDSPVKVGREVGIQTDPINIVSDKESELESDNSQRKRISNKRKRKLLPDKEQLYRKKASKILHVTAQVKNQSSHRHSHTKEDLESVFELKKPIVGQKISLNVDKIKIPDKTKDNKVPEAKAKAEVEPEPQPTKESSPPPVIPFVAPKDLKTNRIPIEQLPELPVFKNYEKGEPSQKLYIKNLHKDVTESDLQSIYERFSSSLTIKLMQKGRMKGQAFVTFDNLEPKKLGVVEEALNETNGFILRTKPMVVCFAKN
ncbi:uncharacterized protein LOC129939644 isoform X1 [Eupeodes corollae]|uniref:uncharacterized protein LOC129939644 isoform X1 n=1 Tax=Eupeodes corollae TaxID=290404 RepID=UPI002490F621|nr:uncharacterized protein LOC129939644 isoform X1 [Eupeodes corollae]